MIKHPRYDYSLTLILDTINEIQLIWVVFVSTVFLFVKNWDIWAPEKSIVPMCVLHPFVVIGYLADSGWITLKALIVKRPNNLFEYNFRSDTFLAATKQLYKWYFPSVCPSVRLSVCPSVCHTFLTMFPSSYHHEIFRSYYQWPK